MLNKALLMAIGGKKKANVPTNGTLHTRISFQVLDIREDWGSFGNVETDEAMEEGYGFTVLEGPGITADVDISYAPIKKFGYFFSFVHWWVECTSTLPVPSEVGVCALVNDETGVIVYGVYGGEDYLGVYEGIIPITPMIFFTESYDEAKTIAKQGGYSAIPGEATYELFTEADVGKTVTLSIYLCD